MNPTITEKIIDSLLNQGTEGYENAAFYTIVSMSLIPNYFKNNSPTINTLQSLGIKLIENVQYPKATPIFNVPGPIWWKVKLPKKWKYVKQSFMSCCLTDENNKPILSIFYKQSMYDPKAYVDEIF
jgi:hypothetical protein